MRAYAIRRVLLIIPTMFMVTLILFILFRMIPSFRVATLVMIYPSIWWSWSPPVQYIPLVEDPLGNTFDANIHTMI